MGLSTSPAMTGAAHRPHPRRPYRRLCTPGQAGRCSEGVKLQSAAPGHLMIFTADAGRRGPLPVDYPATLGDTVTAPRATCNRCDRPRRRLEATHPIARLPGAFMHNGSGPAVRPPPCDDRGSTARRGCGPEMWHTAVSDNRPSARAPGTSGPGQPPGRRADMKISARRNRKLDRTHCLANTRESRRKG